MPQDAALSAELSMSFIGAVGSVGVSLVDTAKRHELAYARLDAVQLSAMSSELEHEAQLTARLPRGPPTHPTYPPPPPSTPPPPPPLSLPKICERSHQHLPADSRRSRGCSWTTAM